MEGLVRTRQNKTPQEKRKIPTKRNLPTNGPETVQQKANKPTNKKRNQSMVRESTKTTIPQARKEKANKRKEEIRKGTRTKIATLEREDRT